MKMLILRRNNKIRVLLGDITPIDDSNLYTATNMLDANHIDKLKMFNKKVLYIIPRNEAGSKGYPFVNAILKKIPDDILVIIVGTKLINLQKSSNIVNIERISTSNLYYLYKNVNITIVPSIYTEAFGRVIIESIINKTPVIISPQCGARFLFEKKEYVKILPLKVDLWLKEINEFLRDPVIIPEEDIKWLENKFSAKNCTRTILNLVKKY
jgi:glycosyltransferase involved in cell wall biosynthesis